MKKISPLRIIGARQFAVVLLAVATSACGKTPMETASSDVSIAVSVSSTAFRPDDGTLVRVTVTNRGHTNISIPHERCHVPFEVLSGKRTVISSTRQVCIAILGPRHVRPGESATEEQRWNGSDWNWATQLKSGQYQLRGKVFVGDDSIVGDVVAVELLPN